MRDDTAETFFETVLFIVSLLNILVVLLEQFLKCVEALIVCSVPDHLVRTETAM